MSTELTDEQLDNMTSAEILEATQAIFIRESYKALRDGNIHPRDMSFVNQLLRNNNVQEKEPEVDSMHDKVLACLTKDKQKT